MTEVDAGFTGSLSKLLDTPAGQGMDSTSLLCMLGLLTVQTIMTVVQESSDKQSTVSEAVKKAGPDLQSLVQALSGMMSAQGNQGAQGGSKVNPAALLALVNTLASQVEKGAAPRQDQKADEPPPARLEHRADIRRGQAEPPGEQRDPRTTGQR